MAQDLVNLQANHWIRTHPLHFLSPSCKAVDVVGLVGEVNWNDVGPVLVSACEPAESQARKQVPTLSAAHLTDQHRHCPLKLSSSSQLIPMSLRAPSMLSG